LVADDSEAGVVSVADARGKGERESLARVGVGGREVADGRPGRLGFGDSRVVEADVNRWGLVLDLEEFPAEGGILGRKEKGGSVGNQLFGIGE